MHILMIFLDGVGLGSDDPVHNPLATANLPTLSALANGQRWLASTGRQESARASFIPTDPRLGVAGRPQSATGQAAILTGLNVPQLIGEHYGPKPDAAPSQMTGCGITSMKPVFSSRYGIKGAKLHSLMPIHLDSITILRGAKHCAPASNRPPTRADRNL